MKTIFLSAHEKSITGGNKRFERLASFAVQNKDAYWVTIEREDIPLISPRILHLARPAIPAFSMRLLWACIRDRKKIKALGRFDRLVVFGETPLLAALFLSWYLKAGMSVGVRSNVPKRHRLELHNKSGIQRLIIKAKYFINHLVIQLAFNKSLSVIVQTPKAKKELCAQYRVAKNKVFFIPNDLPKVPERIMYLSSVREFKARPMKILFVGNSSSIKGFDILMDLIERLPLNTFEFTIVGVLKSKVINTEGVEFIERSDAVFELMIQHDLLIIPSREDQFPNVLLEAMAVNLPVIGSNVDGIKYMIDDKKFVFESGSVDSLFNLFLSVQDEEIYQELIKHTKIRKQNFDFEWEHKYFDLLFCQD